MKLYATPDNPIPPLGTIVPVRTRDGLDLRAARWTATIPGVAPRGTVTIAMGRSEYIEHYYGVVSALMTRGFDVVAFDWRGQGESSREFRRRVRSLRSGQSFGHVTSFAAYRRDLAAVEAQILRPLASKPWFALGHSMGGAVLLDQAHDGLSPFDRMVLTAPMIGLGLRHEHAIHVALRLLTAAGYGGLPIPGGRRHTILNRPFEENVLTSCSRQFRRLGSANENLPSLSVGAPTLQWVVKALDLMRRFEDPRYPLAIATPVLIVAAGADRIVHSGATEKFAARLRTGDFITIPGSRHQLLMERAAITDQFWAAFDSFIPGEPLAGTIDSRAWSSFAPNQAVRRGFLKRAMGPLLRR